ncbi:protein XRP2 [Patella vulgata]|uniref:protein XRP2 n=1 Tax=Patella vulgata TaxID=6465 RepID=UPI00217F618F|nr:protein XRP2 [Patella vulgata]
MGCFFSSCNFGGREHLEENFEDANEQQKVYSWDKRDKVNVQDFIIDGIKNDTVGRLPGDVHGQQIVIQNCENCNIYIFDHTVTLTVDDCSDCNIFLGPVKTSVFIRDCKNCNIAVACQQFRTRDCSKINVYLCCDTQPIIESSRGMKFGCFQYFYPELEGQFKAAGLSVYNNNWSKIHDFTPVPGENNYSLLTWEANLEDVSLLVPSVSAEKFSGIQSQISTENNKSVVPYTLGSRRKTSNESCLVVLFPDRVSCVRAATFIECLRTNGMFTLAQTKEVAMLPEDSVRVFGSDMYSNAVKQGKVIGFEVNGIGCIQFCQETVKDLLQGSTGVAFVSQSQEEATQNIDNFYNFADMQMGV